MDWNGIVTVACCVLTLVATGFSVVVWTQLRDATTRGFVNAERISALGAEIENLKSLRLSDTADLNRRFDEVRDHLNRIERLLSQIVLHRRRSDTGEMN